MHAQSKLQQAPEEDSKVSYRPIGEAPELWDNLVRRVVHCPMEFTRSMVEYYQLYLAEFSKHFEDHSSIIYYNGEPVGIWPLWLLHMKDEWQCGSDGRVSVNPPAFLGSVAEKMQRKIIQACMNRVESLCLSKGMSAWKGSESMLSLGMSEWHKIAMDRGARIIARHELFLDLSQPYNELRSNFRKSFKPLISKAETLWKVSVLDRPTTADMELFRSLHIASAGRETRSIQTWNLQRESVLRDEGFYVFLKDDTDHLVGAALFQHSPTEAKYSSAAYDRSLYEQPVGHLAQDVAIKELQRRQIRWYKVGDRRYVQDPWDNSEKEVQISFFKEGFGPELRLLIHTECLIGAK